MSKKDLYKAITVTVPRAKNIDEAVVKAVLVKLGLKTPEQLAAFSSRNNYNDIVAYCLKYIHFGNNYTGIARAARIAQTVTVTIYVAVGIVNQIKTFLGQVVTEIKNRADDAAQQIGGGLVNAGDGIVKNNLEGLNNLNSGGGRALGGTFNAMTAPVGSDRFWSGAGDMYDGAAEFGKGLGKIFVQTPADAALLLGLKINSGWQTWWGLEHIGRPPDGTERQILSQVFGSSVELDAIRIKAGYAGILNIGKDNGFTLYNNQRAITIGNTIYMKNNPPGQPGWYSTLVHETTHVWQNQNGGTDYMGEALHAQFTAGYGYGDDISNNKKSWAMLNPEQQAQLIQDAYDNGYFQNNGWSNAKPIYVTSQNQTQSQIPAQFMINYMNQVLPQLRNGQGAT